MSLAGTLKFNPITDELTDKNGKPFKLQPPAAADAQRNELPQKGFDPGENTYAAPPPAAEAAKIKVNVSSTSQRLQLLVWLHVVDLV